MATYRKQLIAALAIGAMAVGSLVYVSRTPSATPGEIDKVRVVEDPKPPKQWAINAAYGRGALSNLRAAFVELENHNSEAARMGVVVARSLLSRIAPTRFEPAVGLSGEDVFVLVHSEIRVPGEVNGESVLQNRLDDIRRDVDMSDQDAVTSALHDLNIPLAYTRIDMPLNETRIGIDHVLEALNSNDTERASAMLAKIGKGLRIETVRIGEFEPSAATLGADDAG